MKTTTCLIAIDIVFFIVLGFVWEFGEERRGRENFEGMKI